MNNRKVRTILAYIISYLPTSKLRVFFYGKILKYKITNSSVGWRTVIAVVEAELVGCSIGRNNRFIGPMVMTVKNGASILDNNNFNCGWWASKDKLEKSDDGRSLLVGENTLITINHHFDLVGSFVLGDNSWIAGTGSQFWTHGAGVPDRNITIGKRCYIGSAVRFAPGSSVADNCIVGLGSIVVKKHKESNAVIAGNPAKVLKENYNILIDLN